MQAGDTDKNISRIVERYEASKCFVARQAPPYCTGPTYHSTHTC